MTALIFTGVLMSCNSQQKVSVNGEDVALEDGIYAMIKTNKGEILAELYYEKTPMTVANFVGLAEGEITNDAKSEGEPYYDGLKFHRVIQDFMIQGGDPTGTGAGGPGYKFPDEIDPSLEHDTAGILSMANSGPGTNGSQFFITHKGTPWLNGKHTVFGKVVQGMSVVDSIEQNDVMETVNILREGDAAQNFNADEVFETKKEEIEAEEARKKEEERKRQEQMMQDQMAEVEKKAEGMQKTESGMYYEVMKKGDGPKPENGQQVKMHYAGYMLDGTLFDTSIKELAQEEGKYDERREPYAPFPVTVGPQARVIQGWKEALSMMQVGDKYKILVPPQMAYGSRGAGGVIPPNAWLIFEMEMIEIANQ